MKQTYYELFFLLLSLTVVWVSCADDEGSYDYKDWSDIVSVEGVSIPGSNGYGKVTILEGDLLEITPSVTFKEGVDPSDFSYLWVMGGDTISQTLTLSWVISPVNVNLFDGEAYFWLEIKNNKTGETWKHYPVDKSGSSNYMVMVTISRTARPQIGAIVYEKSDGTIEWGSIKGARPDTPQDFKEIFTEMYSRYNPGKILTGPFVGASLDASQLAIYTQHAPDYGSFIQTAYDEIYPFGNFMGSVRDLTFLSDPTETVKSKKYYTNGMQEILIGNKLFLFAASSTSAPYQLIDPSWNGMENDVAQTMGATPLNRILHINVMRKNNNEVYYYNYSETKGYRKELLKDETGNPLQLDMVTGVFREPSASQVYTSLRFYVVGRIGNEYKMYVYRYNNLSETSYSIDFDRVVDVTNWGDGVNDETQWFTTSLPVPSGGNYAFFIQGKKLWRYSYEALANPVVVKTFNHDAVLANSIAESSLPVKGYDYYTIIFTYDASSDKSTLYTLDVSQENVVEESVCLDAIPGKVEAYLPVWPS